MFRPELSYLVITFAIFLEPSFTAPADQPTRSCGDIFGEANLPQYFADYVVHAIHSVNVEALQEFEPDFDAVNFIPNIDLDLRSTNPIRSHAPTPDKSDFKSQGMRVLDHVLSHMSNPSWEVKDYSTVERLVHNFHMHELWHSIRGEYEKVKSAPPSDDVCQCALDEHNNGILKKLKSMSSMLRQPELFCGNTELGGVSMNGTGKLQYLSPSRLGFYVQIDKPSRLGFYVQIDKPRVHPNDKNVEDQSASITSQKTQIHEDQSNSASMSKDKVPKDSHDCLPALEDEAAWKLWREGAKMTHEGDRSAAVYFYCAHKRANQFKQEKK